jgi:hypothetical protein
LAQRQGQTKVPRLLESGSARWLGTGLCSDFALRIEDARMAIVDPHRRRHYPPAERLAILAIRAASESKNKTSGGDPA